MTHKIRAHSKFSASGAERWTKCPASVHLSEGQPDKSSVWADEGTKAHEILEKIMLDSIAARPILGNGEMFKHALNAARFMLGLHSKTPGAEVLVETRIYLDFIHPEMFGTFDGAVIDHFGTLHVFDFKYGAGHGVQPKENLQMIFYGIGLAALHQWNFKRVRLWIIQPRIKGYDGPTFWDISIQELKSYVKTFEDAVRRIEQTPNVLAEGSWCHWCKAKSVCPLKLEAKADKTRLLFQALPRTN